MILSRGGPAQRGASSLQHGRDRGLGAGHQPHLRGGLVHEHVDAGDDRGAPGGTGAVRDCAAAGVPVVIVCSSGFAETGEGGALLQDELVTVAGELGVRVLGPNCIGTVGTATGQVSSFSPLFSGERTELVPGGLGFVSQSGALGYGAVSLAFERGLERRPCSMNQPRSSAKTCGSTITTPGRAVGTSFIASTPRATVASGTGRNRS